MSDLLVEVSQVAQIGEFPAQPPAGAGNVFLFLLHGSDLLLQNPLLAHQEGGEFGLLQVQRSARRQQLVGFTVLRVLLVVLEVLDQPAVRQQRLRARKRRALNTPFAAFFTFHTPALSSSSAG